MSDAHEDDQHEDPEQHLGEAIPDPWADDTQEDWDTITLGMD